MAFWRYSSLRLRRKEVINALYTQSVSPFSTEGENGVGRGRGAPSLPSLESPPTGAGVDPGSRPAPVQGRGRKSRFAEELGLKFDPAKEEAKLKEYIPEESPHVSRYEDAEISSKKESKIRVVGNTQNQNDELYLQTLNRRKKRSESKQVITGLGKQHQKAISEDQERQRTVKAKKDQKTSTAPKSESITVEDKVSIEGVPEKAEEVVAEKKIPSLTKTAKSTRQPAAKPSSKAADQVSAKNEEIDWLSELTPKQKKVASVESSWLDELGPGVKLQTSPKVHELTQEKPTRPETTVSTAPAQILEEEEEVHYPPVHKAYQEEEDETQPIAEQPVLEVVEEFLVEDKHSANGQILVQFEDEDSVEPPVSSEDGDDDTGEDEGGEATDSVAEQSSTIKSTETKDKEEKKGEEEEEEQSSAKEDEQTESSIQEEEQSVEDEEPSFMQEVEDSSKEEIVSETRWEAFEKYRGKSESEPVSSEMESSGGLASLLQGLMKKDRKQLDSRSQSTGSLMQSLGWESDQSEESQQTPQGAVSPTQMQSQSRERFAQPLESALAERLGWTSPQERFIETFDVEEDFEQRYRRERSPRTRMVDAYGRLKARTPEERRQRAMRSGKAMEMALKGKLDEFDPDDYDEPEPPEPLYVPRGRGRGRGRFRGRGRGRRMSRDVPNLFQQKPIEKTPPMKAAPHIEEDYYHEDAMSKLGVKFSQHELMNMERYIQSLVSPSFNFKTDQPTPWTDLKRSSADQYLETHKGKVKDVMKASGFAFSDERWDQLKRNAIIDFASYKQQDSAMHQAFGESPFKSVKDEEESLQNLLESSLTKDDPLRAHMEVALPMLLANPTWAYSNKKKFIRQAHGFSQRRET